MKKVKIWQNAKQNSVYCSSNSVCTTLTILFYPGLFLIVCPKPCTCTPYRWDEFIDKCLVCGDAADICPRTIAGEYWIPVSIIPSLIRPAVHNHSSVVSQIINIKQSYVLKGHCPAQITKFCWLNFHVISTNITKYTTKWDKKILWSKTEAAVWRKKAGLQGWKWITVHQIWFRDRRSRNQTFHSGF